MLDNKKAGPLLTLPLSRRIGRRAEEELYP